LTGDHRRQDFTCGSAALTDWFRRHALKADQAGTSRVYVVRRLSDDKVIGFYALAGASVGRASTPRRLLQGAGQYDSLPVILLARLAVDATEEGKGLGRALVKDAFKRVAQAAEIVGIRALLIHAEDEQAAGFYMKIAGFERSPTDELHLLLLMKDLRRALAAGS